MDAERRNRARPGDETRLPRRQTRRSLSASERFAQYADRVRHSPAVMADAMILSLFEDVSARMMQCGVSRAELSRLLGVSGAAVTRMLNGNSDLKVSTIAKLAAALDMRAEVRLRPAQTADVFYRRSSTLLFEVMCGHGDEVRADEESAAVAFAA